MQTLENLKIDIMGGQIMSRISAKDSEDKQTIRVVVPKSIAADGSIDINEMPEEEVILNVDEKRVTALGDIVVKLSTPYGAGIVEESEVGCIVPSFCALIKNAGELDRNYLLAFLNSDMCKQQIQAQVTGAVMTVVSIGKIKKLMIPVPSIDEQEEVGRRFIEKKRKLQIMKRIAALEEERNSVVFEELRANENN